jgi:transglutaminase-like putative cysteine protease
LNGSDLGAGAWDDVRMPRRVRSNLVVDVAEPTSMVASVAVSRGEGIAIDDRLVVTRDGVEVGAHEVVVDHGTRLHCFDAEPGRYVIDYDATVDGRESLPAVTDVDEVIYLRPSRYCESDVLYRFATEEFGGLSAPDAVVAVSAWVASHLTYVPGASAHTDGAVHTLLARAGVCRDYAHLTIALLRAVHVPARMVAVYAPELSPMDFHAVAEAAVDGTWRIVDPSGLAPVEHMLRIATGRDAADVAFLSTTFGEPQLTSLTVSASHT